MSTPDPPLNFATLPREIRQQILKEAFINAIILDLERPQELLRVLDEIVAGRLPGAGFFEAHVTALVSVVRGYSKALDDDVQYVLERNKMWAYGEMKEEDGRQVRGRVRGGYVAMRVVR